VGLSWTSRNPTTDSAPSKYDINPRSAGFRVPVEDDDSESVDDSSGSSVQIMESRRQGYSVPSTDDDLESSDCEVVWDDDDDDDEEEVQITSSAAVQDNAGDISPQEKLSTIENTEPKNTETASGPRSLNLKGTSLQDLLTKTAAEGSSQQNPIDLEDAPRPKSPIPDSESEDDDEGPEELPIPQPRTAIKDVLNRSPSPSEQPQRPQHARTVFVVDEADLDPEGGLVATVLETQAQATNTAVQNNTDKAPEDKSRSTFYNCEVSNPPPVSIANATDGYNSFDDDEYDEDCYPVDEDDFELDSVAGSPREEKIKEVDEHIQRVRQYAHDNAHRSHEEICKGPYNISKNTEPVFGTLGQPMTLHSHKDVDGNLLPLDDAAQGPRAPSPSDAALAKASPYGLAGASCGYSPSMTIPTQSFVSANNTNLPPFDNSWDHYQTPKHMFPETFVRSASTDGREASSVCRSRMTGPLDRLITRTPLRSSVTTTSSGYRRGVIEADMTRITSRQHTQAPQDAQSSKLNISNLVNASSSEQISTSQKRKAEMISGDAHVANSLQDKNDTLQTLMNNGINPTDLSDAQLESFQKQSPRVRQQSCQVYAQILSKGTSTESKSMFGAAQRFRWPRDYGSKSSNSPISQSELIQLQPPSSHFAPAIRAGFEDGSFQSGPSPDTAQATSVAAVSQETPLPDAQPRETLVVVPEPLIQEDDLPVTASTTNSTEAKKSHTDGPARKKVKTSSSSSGGILKFVSGAAVGAVGVLAAIISTVPANVYEEALREVTNVV